MFVRSIIAAAFVVYTSSTAITEEYVCKVPKEKTVATNQKMLQFNALVQRLKNLRKNVPENKTETADCSDTGKSILRQMLVLAKDIHPSLQSLKCPSQLISEYRENISTLNDLISGCSSAPKKPQTRQQPNCTEPRRPVAKRTAPTTRARSP